MGTVEVTIGVGDSQGRRFEDLEVTVDTGSTFAAVPRELLQRLRVPVERSVQSELADGSVAPVDVGRTIIRLERKEFPTPVIFRRGSRTQPAGCDRAGGRSPSGGPRGKAADTGKSATPVTKGTPWLEPPLNCEPSR